MEENKKNKIPNVPNLGFGDASYLATKIRDVSNVVSGGTPDTSNPNYWDGEINWFTPSEIGNSKYVENSKRRITSLGYKNCGAKLMSPGSILLSSRATVGDASISKTECCTNQGFQSLTDFKCCGQYLYYYLQTFQIHKSLIRRASGSTFLEISNYEVGNTDIFIPDLNTQEKIAIFLSKIDDRIETQNKIIGDLTTLRKGIIDTFFKNSISSTRLSKYLSERKTYSEKGEGYEHVTLSKDGICPKTDRYDRDFLVKSEDKNYKITKLNDICYNPANLKFRVICLNNYGDAIFSPIYVTFEVKNIDPYYLSLYLTSEPFIKRILKYQQGTVYERMAVSPNDFCKGTIPDKNKEEISNLINVVYVLDKKIKNEIKVQESFNIQKYYLLDNLFI